jgi:hypothetical protein
LRRHNANVYSISIGALDDHGAPLAPIALPGTVPLPAGSIKAVIRLSEPDSMLNEDIRVQNEVAVMTLIRKALEPYGKESVVPLIYGWSPTVGGTGWTLIEHMSGVNIVEEFPSLDLDKKRDILRDMALIFKCIQSYQLPQKLQGYGGLNYDEDGDMILGKTPIAGGGPCNSLADLYSEYFQTQTVFAEKCKVIQGWKDSTKNLKLRLERFAAEGLKPLLQKNLKPRSTIVHGDFGKHSSTLCLISSQAINRTGRICTICSLTLKQNA